PHEPAPPDVYTLSLHDALPDLWQDGRLVGGLYGVRLGRAFFGESMFHRERDASKVALAHLVARLKRGNFALLDAQFITEHLWQLDRKSTRLNSSHVKISYAVFC